MAKYSFELKLRLVKEYLLGNDSLRGLSDKYSKGGGQKGHVQIRKWVNAYQSFGEEGLLRFHF